MDLEFGGLYHLYNRSSAKQVVYRCHDNYQYFLSKYQRMLSKQVDTLAYCLMPTHFHFLIRVKTHDIKRLQQTIGCMESSYTQAINAKYDRHGSLFQLHTKAKEVRDLEGMLRLIRYIHQNPVLAGHVYRAEDWPYSSFKTMIGNEPNPIIRLMDLPELQTRHPYFLKVHRDLIKEQDIHEFFHKTHQNMRWAGWPAQDRLSEPAEQS